MLLLLEATTSSGSTSTRTLEFQVSTAIQPNDSQYQGYCDNQQNQKNNNYYLNCFAWIAWIAGMAGWSRPRWKGPKYLARRIPFEDDGVGVVAALMRRFSTFEEGAVRVNKLDVRFLFFPLLRLYRYESGPFRQLGIYFFNSVRKSRLPNWLLLSLLIRASPFFQFAVWKKRFVRLESSLYLTPSLTENNNCKFIGIAPIVVHKADSFNFVTAPFFDFLGKLFQQGAVFVPVISPRPVVWLTQ